MDNFLLEACCGGGWPPSTGNVYLAFLGIGAAIAAAVPTVTRFVSGAAARVLGGGARVAAAAKGLPVAVKAAAGGAGGTALVSAVEGQLKQLPGGAPPLPSMKLPFVGALPAGAPGVPSVSPTGVPTVVAPVGGASIDKFGRPMVVQAAAEVRVKCPPGYVAITMPDGSRACALKGVARAAGLWKGRRKPPISAKDWHTLQTAERTKKKVRKVARMAKVSSPSRRGKR